MNCKKMRLLQAKEADFFLDGIQELYHVIEQDPAFEVSRQVVRYGRLKSYLVRALSAMPFLFHFRINLEHREQVNFSAMISGDFRLMLPYVFFTRQNYIYMHDAWPRFQSWIFPLLNFFNIRYVFFSSKQVLQDHLKKDPQSTCKSMWLPEALNASEYHFESYANKTIDVLEFGRMYQEYHDLIQMPLTQAGKNHQYRKQNLPMLYPDKPSFVQALAQTKIVICVPSDITHPERAEYISTMTLRYLQAMASKCLIVGVTPFDMRELFDYDAIIEIDMKNAAQQLLSILDNYESYLSLIERNYQEVLLKHQWIHRWAIMKQKIEEVHE
ncbi:glycosyltransferase [Pedobacter psychrodurus]|uniref:glycosyltransferase n=1 Tax=Pedobacter psychrodurus TaxID=2530456 RepID=UPI002930C804|nr:glycosyltransferase [Pedobacter psychrodurus]